jgi:hypothetical protein
VDHEGEVLEAEVVDQRLEVVHPARQGVGVALVSGFVR